MRRTLLLNVVAQIVSRLMLACLFVVVGVTSLALMAVSPVFGFGTIFAGSGLRLISPCTRRMLWP